MALVKNLKFFHPFIFGKIRQENVFDDILERKKSVFRHYNQKDKKELGFFQRVLVKKLKIFHVFIFGKTKQETVFEDILGRKKKLSYTLKSES